jgi:hypothetical protein
MIALIIAGLKVKVSEDETCNLHFVTMHGDVIGMLDFYCLGSGLCGKAANSREGS